MWQAAREDAEYGSNTAEKAGMMRICVRSEPSDSDRRLRCIVGTKAVRILGPYCAQIVAAKATATYAGFVPRIGAFRPLHT